MSACLVFLAVASQKSTGQLKIQTGPQKGKIPVGADVATIGKMRPGHYVANRDFRSLPPVNDLGDKILVFSGNVYVLAGDKAPQITPFIGGRKRIFNRDKGTVEYGDSLRDYLHSLDAKADVRAAEATYASFEVTLPTDAKKLADFVGTITFFVQNMKPEQALTITLKKGKVVRSMP